MKQLRPRPRSMRPGLSRQEQLALLEEWMTYRRRDESRAAGAKSGPGRDDPPLPMRKESTRKEQPVIARSTIERTVPQMKLVVATLGWGNSIVTSMLTGAQLQRAIWLLDHPNHGVPFPLLGLLLGALISIICTIGQIYTIDRHRMAYLLALSPDVLTTALQWWIWILAPLARLIPDSVHTVGMIGLGGSAILIGWFSARLPERVVFGPRPPSERNNV